MISLLLVFNLLHLDLFVELVHIHHHRWPLDVHQHKRGHHLTVMESTSMQG